MAEEDMTITRELMQSLKTPSGGYTREQLAILGVEWPPRKGWLNALIGTRVKQSTVKCLQQMSLKTKSQERKKDDGPRT